MLVTVIALSNGVVTVMTIAMRVMMRINCVLVIVVVVIVVLMVEVGGCNAGGGGDGVVEPWMPIARAHISIARVRDELSDIHHHPSGFRVYLQD